MRLLVLLLLCCFSVLLPSCANPGLVDDNTGLTASSAPHIPEPMVFDLVRPLGAKKGELEVNVLGLKALSRQNRSFAWAPEIEYTFADGFGVELEFPFRDFDLREYKLGLQGTLSKDIARKYIHGWQTLTRLEAESREFHWDLLHISAYKVSLNTSVVTMLGFRQDFLANRYQFNPLFNVSYFKSLSHKARIGFEVNYEMNDLSGVDFRHNLLLMPQAHYEIGKFLSLQLGAGVERFNEKINPIFGTRLVLEL